MGLGSELMEAPEDEETFDMMNDETFGDVDDGKLWIKLQLTLIYLKLIYAKVTII